MSGNVGGRGLYGLRALAFIAFLVLLPLRAYPQVTGPNEAKPGELVIINADIPDSRVVWSLSFPEDFTEYRAEGGELILAMPSKKLKFTLIVVPNATDQPLRIISHVISPIGTTPKPPVEPDGPNNAAGFTLQKTDTLFLVYESSQSDHKTARIRLSTFWQIGISGQGYKRPQTRDIDSDEGKQLKQEAAESIPFFCVKRDSKIVLVFKAESVDELKEAIGWKG